MYAMKHFRQLNINVVSEFLVCLLLLMSIRSVPAVEAQKPEISLADLIQQENKIHREQFFGDLKLLHSPYAIDIQFSADGSVLFSLAETVRLWRSDTGAYLGSISGPAKFRRFTQLYNSRWIVTVDDIYADEDGSYYGVPHNLPNLRIWDVITGKCLSIRQLEMPVNTFKISVDSLEPIEQYQMVYLILNYMELTESRSQLLGFQGQKLIPDCKLEFENKIDSLTWVPQTRQLHINSGSNVSGFDPDSKMILWKKELADSVKPIKSVDELIAIDHPNSNNVWLRFDSALQRWHLEKQQGPFVKEKMIWSKAANRVCHIQGETEEINLFNAKTKKRVTLASGMVNALSPISANNFSGSFDYSDVFVFQFGKRDHIHRTFTTQVAQNSCVAISTDATTLVVGKTSGKGKVWSLSDRKVLFTLTGCQKELLCIAADTLNKRIVAGDNYGNFWRWNFPAQSTVTTEKVPQIIAEKLSNPIKSRFPGSQTHDELTNSLCTLSPDGMLSLYFRPFKFKFSPVFPTKKEDIIPDPGIFLIANLEYERKFGELIASDNAKKTNILAPAIGLDEILIQIKSSPDGRFATLVFSTGQVTVIDLQTETLESIIQTGDSEIVDVDFHPDKNTLLVASYRGTVTAWNTDTFLQTGKVQLYDARLENLSSRITKKGFDIVLGTRDTGLIVKRNVFKK